MKRNVPAVCIALCLVVLAAYQTLLNPGLEAEASSAAAPFREMKYNQPVPSFTLQGLDGKTYRVGGQRDKPLMINFWASWCGPCKEEAPDLAKVYEKYKDKFDLYAVNVTREDRMADVQSFVKRNGFTFPVLLDKEGATAELYRILFVPTSFLIDKQGVLREVIHVLPPEQLEQRIQSLIQG
ncbi:TlpA disulfide reductase family protein [Paenibacillus sp. OAS669]|uniref:TlpA disulfide reductase family protein n=1 Tax=Paenibacillus sp. OAS669 TaxID=2663821 RepID=UPI00178A44D3|nr:TlpA disulfide reductase family protein [Paenibacillus sp. OAS669]MBE1441064.1 thiol-disulfide isomerase/thioredoxin [Paenibacillus sp. OAS669]